MGGFEFESRSRPILKWAGGKTKPLSQLLPFFPERFERYFEPFLGGAAVFLSLKRPTPATLNDFNPELIELYQVLREEPEALRTQLDVLAAEYSESFYYALRQSSPPCRVERAARTVFLNKTGFNGLYRLNASGLFNVPFGKRPKCPALYDPQNWTTVAERFREATLSQGDFEAVIDQAGAGDFVYCDPPYEPLSASSAFTAYTPGGFGIDQQQRLESACRRAVARGAVVAISNSTAPSILLLYREWRVERISVPRAINAKASGRGPVDEVLVLGPEYLNARGPKTQPETFVD